MNIYKKIKKDFVLVDVNDVKIGDIIKIQSTKTNKFVTKSCFVDMIVDNKIYLQHGGNSNLIFEMDSLSLI